MLRWLSSRLVRRWGRRPLQEQASGFGAGVRRTMWSDLCVGRPDGIVQEDWAIKLGIFPVCSVLLILFDSSSFLLLRRRLRGGSDVS